MISIPTLNTTKKSENLLAELPNNRIFAGHFSGGGSKRFEKPLKKSHKPA
jgi:hypothetical protein